jgi:chromosome segregation and condensation protein ScpB
MSTSQQVSIQELVEKGFLQSIKRGRPSLYATDEERSEAQRAQHKARQQRYEQRLKEVRANGLLQPVKRGRPSLYVTNEKRLETLRITHRETKKRSRQRLKEGQLNMTRAAACPEHEVIDESLLLYSQ